MKQTYSLKERLLAWVMTLAMVVGMFPTTVFADTSPAINLTFSNPSQGASSVSIVGAVSDDSLTGTWTWELTDNKSLATITNSDGNATISSELTDGAVAFTVGFAVKFTYTDPDDSTEKELTNSGEITFTPSNVTLVSPTLSPSQTNSVEEGSNKIELTNSGSFPAGTVFTWTGTDVPNGTVGTAVTFTDLEAKEYKVYCTATYKNTNGYESTSESYYIFTPAKKATANYKVSISGETETTSSFVTVTGSAMNTDKNEADDTGTWYWQIASSNASQVTLSNNTSASPTITLNGNLTSTMTVTVRGTYTALDGGTAVNTHTVTFKIAPNYSMSITYGGDTVNEGDTITVERGASNVLIESRLDSSASGTTKWSLTTVSGTVDDLITTTSSTNTFGFTAKATGTVTVKASHPNDASIFKTFKIAVVLGDPIITPPSGLTSGKVTFSGTSSKTFTFTVNRGVEWSTFPTGVVEVEPTSSTTTTEKITVKPVGNGTAVVTGTLNDTARSSTSFSFEVTVTGISDGGDADGDNSGGSGGSGDSGDSGDSDTGISKEYVPLLTPSGASGNIVLATRGNYADRKILVTAEQVDNGAPTATSNELSTQGSLYSKMLQWKVEDSNLSEMVSIANGQRFYYSNPGETKVTYWIDFNDNMEVDDDEVAYSGTFSITNTGISVSETNVNMSTYANSSSIYVYTYGDVGTITSASQNTTLATVTQTSVSSGVYSLIIGSGAEVGDTNIIVSYNGGTESIAVSITDAVAGNILVGVDANINSANPLFFKDILQEMHDQSSAVYAGETLVRLQSLEVAPSQGILYIGYQDPDHTGGAVGTSVSYYVGGSPGVEDIAFVPNPYFTGTEVLIVYTGYTTSGRSFYGEIYVTLSEIKDVQVVTTAQTSVTLSSSDFSSIAQATMAQNLASLVFTLPEENQAVFYYDYDDASNFHHKILPGEVLSLADLDKVTIVPSPSFGTPPQNGDYTELNITYTATGTNNMVKTQIMVLRVYPYKSGEAVVYNTRQGEYLTLVTADFHENSQYNSGNYNAAGDFEGVDMSHITFTLPSPTQGTLYEDYKSTYDYRRAVTEGTYYYASYREPMISEVAFVPAEGFSGVVNIPFVGYDVTGSSYKGTLQINVTTHGSQDINYICTAGSYVSFYAEDFNQLSRNLVGNNIDSITFTGTPDSYQGSLRLGQTPDGYVGVDVFTGNNFYRTGSPYIDSLSFSSSEGFTGTVEIPFNGVSTTGQIFSATISITVTNQNVVQIPYSATRYYPVTMNESDFEKFSILRTDSELDYVRFQLPDPAMGTLYYDYEDLSNYDSFVTIDDDFFSNKEQFLNKVTFVPAADFVGTAYVDFTAWGVNGQDFVGRISIMVAESRDPLYYEIHSGEYVFLNSSAMNSYVRDELGYNIDYMTLTLPTSRQGTLYQAYSPFTGSGDWELASSSKRYYRSEDYNISNLAFVSGEYFIGTVELSFTAVSEEGTSCTGIITIVVLPLEANNVIEYYTSFSPIIFKTTDISAVWNNSLIDYIELHNLPAPDSGKLYYENNLSSFATIDEFYYGYDSSRGKSIDTLIFVPQAGYTGTAAIAYTAMTVAGTEFTGEIHIIVTPQQVSQYYVDMSDYAWAISSADYLNTTQVSFGIGNYKYGPSNNVSRGDFALMVLNAFRLAGSSSAEQFYDVPTDKYYASAIHTLRELGIVSGEDNLFHPESAISRQDAMIILCRAMEVANKKLPTVDISVLYRYRDVTAVYVYASGDLSIMVQAGIVSGDDNLMLHPQALMTRAEMAVVIHKAMTY